MGEKPVMLVGLDESDHSMYALKWTLDHFFVPLEVNKIYKLVLVHAKRASPAAVISLASHGAGEVVAIVTEDLKKMAHWVADQAKMICVEDVVVEVVDGEARGVICEAVDRHHASLLVLGSQGYRAIKRAVLGSVSDYCAHHAHCSVMIVKRPKPSTSEEHQLSRYKCLIWAKSLGHDPKVKEVETQLKKMRKL